MIFLQKKLVVNLTLKNKYYEFFFFFLLIFLNFSSYTQQTEKIKKWYKPNHVRVQFAGNIGMFSLASGWSFFNNNLELSLSLGYVPKFVTKQKEWLENNSKAQKIAQNRPEVKKRNSEAVKNFRQNNPEMKKQVSKK